MIEFCGVTAFYEYKFSFRWIFFYIVFYCFDVGEPLAAIGYDCCAELFAYKPQSFGVKCDCKLRDFLVLCLTVCTEFAHSAEDEKLSSAAAILVGFAL